ncbi:MAG: ATP-binding cassette domain-containing protein, partial [Lachnospiraceae bacterium]|nr:ATP-binding cassette domain-containing protein [Lachnospiraceae bacterium]
MKIQVKDISKIYGSNESKVIALNHASLTISEGDFISIMGPSGSGKSTLLHIVSGLDQPSMGSVLYGDTDIHNGEDKKLSA